MFKIDMYEREYDPARNSVVCSVASQPDMVSFSVSLYGNAVLVKPFRNGWRGFDEDETARLLELLCKGLGAERMV